MRLKGKTNRFHVELLERRRLLSFGAGVDYPVSNTAAPIMAADLNGDGRADLAVPNWSDQTVSVLLSNADETLGAPQSFPTGGISLSLAAGDLNGDGNIDLAMANSNSAPSLLLGNGNGTFQSPRFVPVTPPQPPPGETLSYYYAKDVAVADSNADGEADLLFSGEAWCYFEAEGGTLYGYAAASLGQGDGTFAPSFSDLDGWGHIAVADVNLDDKVDMVWPNGIRYGRGDGTFNVRQEISPALDQLYGLHVTADDFNGDGNVDVAATSGGGINGGYVVLGNGNGTFGPAQSYASGQYARALEAADFNGDGKMDLITAHAATGADGFVAVCVGNGNGSFKAPLSFPASPYPYGPGDVTAGDFNGDGRTDVAITSHSIVRVLLNNGNWATKTWIGPASSGNWSTAANWSPGGVPSAGDLVTIADKSVTLSSSARVGALNLTGGATLNVVAAGNRMLRTSSLTITGSGSTLDLNDNDLILDYSSVSPVGVWTGSDYDGVTGMLLSGRITSSLASGNLKTLGVAEAREALNITGSQTGTFAGEVVDSTAVLVKFTWGGDANLDGKLNIDDYGRIDGDVAQSGLVFGWFNGDFNLDGKINIDDYGIIDGNINQQNEIL